VMNTYIAIAGVSIGVGLILVGCYMMSYRDYASHKRPLQEADPRLASSYTYLHHLRVVALPLVKYRLSITVDRKQ
jgi:hypothetical protein